MPCPSCGEPASPTDLFCESCGAPLTSTSLAAQLDVDAPPLDSLVTDRNTPPHEASARLCSCGGTIDTDGWCTVCGVRAPSERDHFTSQPAPHLAMVCDKGIVHTRNEDAGALAYVDGRCVLVVCDGVTTATDSDAASLAAAVAACSVLEQSPVSPSTSPGGAVEYWASQLDAATHAAQLAAAGTAASIGKVENPPSCTYVAAVVDGPLLVVASIGDSRAYWFGDDDETLQISSDDSWATDQISHGIARAVAEADPRAHAITRWLGIDSPGGPPSVVSKGLESAGWVLVCSDGLWNYCSDASSLASLLKEAVTSCSGDVLATASALVDWANAQGGHDNITVALARVESVTFGLIPEPSQVSDVPAIPAVDTTNDPTRSS